MLKMSVEWVLAGSNHVVFKSSSTEKDAEGVDKIRAFYNEPVKNPLKFASSKKVRVAGGGGGKAVVEKLDFHLL